MNALLAAILAGFAGHQLERPIAHLLPDDDMARLAKYGVGSTIILAVFAAVAPRRRAAILAMTMLGVGAGVIAGYLLDGTSKK